MKDTEENLLEFPFFHSLHPHPHIPLSKKTEPVIDTVIREMIREYVLPERINVRLLRSYLDVVLLKLAAHYNPEKKDEVLSTTSKLRRLESLIDRHYVKLKQPREYAELMNLSPSYLNNLCKQALGKTLSDLIQERILLEAKRFFAYSDLTIAQVSDKLNFKDPSYFIRFFKKLANVTPEQFREQLKSTI